MIGSGHLAAFEGGIARLGAWGKVKSLGIERYVIELTAGYDVPGDAELIGGTLWLDEDSGILILIPFNGEEVLLVDLANGECLARELLLRDERPDLRFMRLAPTPDGRLILLYERGMVLMGVNGYLEWHVYHDDISARIVDISDDRVVLETQWPDDMRGILNRYSLSDGSVVRSD